MEPSAPVDERSVAELMNECSCTRERAVSLLQLNSNNITKAKRVCQLYSDYKDSLPPGPRSSPEQHPASWSTSKSRVSTPTPALRLFNSPRFSSSNAEWGPNVVAAPSIGSGQKYEKLDHLEPMGWDITLPDIAYSGPIIPGVGDNQGTGKGSFSIVSLAGAVLHGASTQDVYDYLAYYDEQAAKRWLQAEVHGFPSIFYAVASNNVDILRLWVSYGARVSATHEHSGIPLIAFAIMYGDNISGDTTAMVAALLSLGASPRVIPKDMYTQLWFEGEHSDHHHSAPTQETAWCTEAARKRLMRSLNLSHRYVLWRATELERGSPRNRQVNTLRNAEPILAVPYLVIGQTIAVHRLARKLLSHLIIPSRRPLVLLFAGRSGHGKTELALQLGHILGLPLEVVNCAIAGLETDLFGWRHPHTGADRGSPLNNFLARNAGQRCIVFLDQFEKTTKNVHQALIGPSDNGVYQDRRDLAKVHCNNTIWILATNALDNTIKVFCDQNQAIFYSEGEERDVLIQNLSKTLRADFLTKFDAPMTGRISDFIPFLPFSPIEQAVVAHKFLLEFAREVREPVRLAKMSSSASQSEQLLGNINLVIVRDLAVCRRLAMEYNPDLGARSILAAVETVKERFIEAYLEGDDEEVEEDGVTRDFFVDIKGGEVVVYRAKGESNSGM